MLYRFNCGSNQTSSRTKCKNITNKEKFRNSSCIKKHCYRKCTRRVFIILDGDDELYSNETLKEIDEHIKENKYDIIYLGYENVGHTENYYRISTKENSTREARLICDESFSVSSKVWNVEFLRNNNIRFKEGMYYEDELFSIKSNILSKVTTYGEFPIFKYHRNREGSVMTKPTIKKCSDWYRMVAEVTDLYEITPEEDRKYLLSFLKMKVTVFH